jgi:hypothetical protein
MRCGIEVVEVCESVEGLKKWWKWGKGSVSHHCQAMNIFISSPYPLKDAIKGGYVRHRQILQWFFAAAPGHPVLRQICDSIAANVYTKFSADPNRDTLERTGPGIWTDKVLEHALKHPPRAPGVTWSIRILPQIVFGVWKDISDMPCNDTLVAIIHHFLGSWKAKESWRDCDDSPCVVEWITFKLKR